MANKTQTSSELVPVQGQTTALATIDEMLAQDLAREMEAGGFNLPRIEINHKDQVFKMPPGDVFAKTFRGIYLGEARFNIMFPPKAPGQAEEKQVPLCIARDAIHGSAEATLTTHTDTKTGAVTDESIYGKCSQCFYNKFGSGAEGVGKACKNSATLMIWPVGVDTILPYVLSVSSTGLTFRVLSAPNGISVAGSEVRAAMPVLQAPPTAIEAEFFLERQQKGSNVWSILHAKIVGKVSPDDYLRCRDFAAKYMPWLTTAAAEEEIQQAEVVDEAGY